MEQGALFAGQGGGDSVAGAYARVAVERGIDVLEGDGGLTYAVMGEAPQVGERVEVPLGRGSRLTPGIVVRVGGPELLEGVPAGRVKAIGRRTGATLPRSLLELARWMAEYYVCPLGMVLSGMMPAAVKHGTGRRRIEVVRAIRRLPDAAPPRGTGKVWSRLLEFDGTRLPMPVKTLAGEVGEKGITRLKRLAAVGLLELAEEEVLRAGAPASLPSPGPGGAGVALTADQHAAVEGVWAHAGAFGVHLLRGVTGSGKTEVYLRLMSRAVEAGRSVIVLVPEIALTPQTASRFTERLGKDRVAVLHSGLTASQRHREWARAATGEARVVVGARSAVFAPLDSLGLIVVDEEHEGSYKQDRLPRYHGRDVAIKRAQQAGCPIVLGSATPSMESWHNASQGRYRLWELPGRVGGAVLPEVAVVDMAEQQRARRESGLDDGRVHLLGLTLEREVERELRAGGQVMLLLNRRGWAGYVWCRGAGCGFVQQCDHCDSNLVVHRSAGLPPGGIVRCHHCDAEQRIPRVCPVCGLWGGGTQRLEDEVVQKFAGLGIEEGRTLQRLDSDSMRGARDYFKALSRFASGEVRMLVGTQMIAKGLDFPNVGLVGVVDADLALYVPDFRAAERTFQLVSQVAGRAGRGARRGRVVVQTMNPGSAAVSLAARHDYVAFAALEMAVRTRSVLPPTTRMARVVCRDEKRERALEAGNAVAAALTGQGVPGVRVRGPVPCVVSRIAGHYRFAVDLMGDRAGDVQRALQGARAAGLLRSDAHTAVDVDPVSLM